MYLLKNKQSFIFRLVLFLFLGIGVNSCMKSEGEYISEFNKTYAPEYNILDDNLYVNWKGKPENHIGPLKLKIPLVYLRDAVKPNGKIDTLKFSLYPMKKSKEFPNKGKYINSIEIAMTLDGKPVVKHDENLFDSEESIQRKLAYGNTVYTFGISSTPRKGDPVNQKKYNGYDDNSRNLFRDKDVNGLENYKDLSCYDIEELKKDIKFKRDGYVSSQTTLYRLKNKAVDDITPKNCLPNMLTQFWISPPDTPENEAVSINCSTTANCRIIFLYKSYPVGITTRKNYLKVIPVWKVYRQQVIEMLKKFETQS